MLRSPSPHWLSQDPGMKTVLIHGMVMAPTFWSCFAPTIVREGQAAAYPLPGHSPWTLEGLSGPLEYRRYRRCLCGGNRRATSTASL